MELARGDAIAWDAAEGRGRVDRAHVPQRPDQRRSPAAPTRCSATRISEQVLGLPREPSFERDKPFDQVLRDAAQWDGRI